MLGLCSGGSPIKPAKPLIKNITNIKFFLSVDIKDRHITKLNKEEMKNVFWWNGSTNNLFLP